MEDCPPPTHPGRIAFGIVAFRKDPLVLQMGRTVGVAALQWNSAREKECPFGLSATPVLSDSCLITLTEDSIRERMTKIISSGNKYSRRKTDSMFRLLETLSHYSGKLVRRGKSIISNAGGR